jgi:hypothetical protein
MSIHPSQITGGDRIVARLVFADLPDLYAKEVSGQVATINTIAYSTGYRIDLMEGRRIYIHPDDDCHGHVVYEIISRDAIPAEGWPEMAGTSGGQG